MSWYNDLATHVQAAVQDIEWSDELALRPVEVTSRPKTIDTLRQKLQRDHDTPLPNIQDIAGVRVEAEMNLWQQDIMVIAICEALPHCATQVRDLRTDPHSGYRAVHIWVRAFGGRAEIQVRTHIQGAWANMYESAGDLFGREIRYGAFPQNDDLASLVKSLQEASVTRAARLEDARNTLDELDRKDSARTGSHKASKGRGAMVQEKRRLRRLYSKYESEFQTEMAEMRTLFESARRNLIDSDGKKA